MATVVLIMILLILVVHPAAVQVVVQAVEVAINFNGKKVYVKNNGCT